MADPIELVHTAYALVDGERLLPDHTALVGEVMANLQAGGDVVAFFFEMEFGMPVRLRIRSVPISARQLVDVAEMAAEIALARCSQITDASGPAARRHLEDALHSLQAVSLAVDEVATTTIGRA